MFFNYLLDDEYCVGSTTKILSGTLEDFQTTNGSENPATCDKYYSCSSNLCSDVTSVSTCKYIYLLFYLIVNILRKNL